MARNTSRSTVTTRAKQGVIKAAAYARKSTDHQQYSTDNQFDVIKEYAARRGMEIVKIYCDDGRSGLSAEGRDFLGKMIADVQSGEAEFSCILVYDVSRWGRFQDVDEAAHYEFVCRKAGITVHYCAEQFENDGSIGASVMKAVKRTMAGEYSRELSTKVFQGACRLIELGFKQGGMAGYGLRRMLVDQNREPKGILQIGEQKSLQTDRVILVPGPKEEVANVRWMYQAFVHEGKPEAEIARILNARGVRTDLGHDWSRGTVHEVLTNEKYIGNNIYHRTSRKLKGRLVTNTRDKWVRGDGAFEGIVDIELFHMAQGIILARSRKLSDEQMLDKLREVLQAHGRISGILIDESENLPSSSAFRHRFGSLVTAYHLIGYDPDIDFGYIEVNRQLRRQYPLIVEDTIGKLRAQGADVSVDEDTDLLHVNREIRVSLVLCRHFTTDAGSSRWLIRLDEGLKPDITIAVRMNAANSAAQDHYLLPSIVMTWDKLRLAQDNGVYLDAYRHKTLDRFFELARRSPVEEEEA